MPDLRLEDSHSRAAANRYPTPPEEVTSYILCSATTVV